MISIHQPSYFPWLGLLNKIAKSDSFLVMDEVQLSDSGFQNRNIFLTPDKKVKYLTISFDKKGYTSKRFCDLDLRMPQTWQEEHARTLRAYYEKHRFFSEIWSYVEPIFTKKYLKLGEPVIDSMLISMQMLGVTKRVIYQSALNYDRSTRKNDLVLQLVSTMGVKTYLAGEGSRGYLELESFAAADIVVKWNNFQHPEYQQRNCDTFHAGLSCLDLLFNYGIENARELFWKSVRTEAKHA
jgi:hypothetical protein